MERFQLSGKGEIFSYTTIFDRQYAPAGFELRTPYTVALVKLNEGSIVTAMLGDLDTSKPRAAKRPEDQRVFIGQRVEMVTRRLFEDEGADGDKGKGMIVYGIAFRPELLPAPPGFSLTSVIDLAIRSVAHPEDKSLDTQYATMFAVPTSTEIHFDYSNNRSVRF